MKLTKWKEFLAAGGVILSLLFVGVEISQNTSATRGQTRTELAALNQEWLFLIAEQQSGDLFRRAWIEEQDDLHPDEVGRAEFLMIANIRRLENVYFQYIEGLVDESALESYGFRTNTNIFNRGAFTNWWFTLENRKVFHADFVELFEQRMGIENN